MDLATEKPILKKNPHRYDFLHLSYRREVINDHLLDFIAFQVGKMYGIHPIRMFALYASEERCFFARRNFFYFCWKEMLYNIVDLSIYSGFSAREIKRILSTVDFREADFVKKKLLEENIFVEQFRPKLKN